MAECLFCKLVSGEIPTDKIFENEAILAFRDVSPQAPTHALIIPKKHIATLNDIETHDCALLGELFLVAKSIANALDIAQTGYRTVVNCNAAGGQSVFHIHMHLLGGRSMSWPPG